MSVNFNRWMRAMRMHYNIPLAVMAKDFGLTPSAYRDIEAGRVRHTPMFEKLVRYYFELCDPEPERPEPPKEQPKEQPKEEDALSELLRRLVG